MIPIVVKTHNEEGLRVARSRDTKPFFVRLRRLHSQTGYDEPPKKSLGTKGAAVILDSFLKVVDRLIGLVQERREHKRKLFEDHVEPLFLDLAMIHKDYCNAFTFVDHKVLDSSIPAWELARDVQELKSELEAIREKVFYLLVSLEEVLGEKPHEATDPVINFVGCAVKYFEIGAGEGSTLFPVRGSTFFTTLLDLIYIVENQRINRNEAEFLAELLCREVRARWSDVTRAYAEARVSLLSAGS